MKPIVTWVVLANARAARVYAHLGSGNGLTAISDQSWQTREVSMPRDKPGVGHSICGPGALAVKQILPKELVDDRFAKDVVADLSVARLNNRFDRLILICGPYMLRLLRANLDAHLIATLLGEIPKDLSTQSLSNIETHLGELIAV